MNAIPQAAIDAAQAYDLAHRPMGRGWGRVPDHQVARLLAGAAPHIAAAERERIRQLAEKNWAVYTHFRAANTPGERRPFADLLTEPEAPDAA